VHARTGRLIESGWSVKRKLDPEEVKLSFHTPKGEKPSVGLLVSATNYMNWQKMEKVEVFGRKMAFFKDKLEFWLFLFLDLFA
jgi:hypothetical protein